ncbi:VOC family protein [Pseudomonas protegens]|uniref:VOC family protein n=1 Tax=Pseudomonas protegens TaxID=380021 RepID=UPI003905FDAB
MKVSKLAYVGTHASDIEAWKAYAPQVLGLEVSPDSSEKLLYLRADERHHRLSIHPGDSDDIAYIGWEVANRDALQAIAARLDNAGIKVSPGTPADLVERRVMDMIYFICPHTGVRTELTVGNEVIFNPRFMPTRPLAGFKTGELGLGHVVLYVTTDLRKVVDFYVKTLGFGISDWVRNPEGMPLAAFLHCNPRHHSLALIFYPPAPRKIQHVFFETNSLDDVGTTYDLCKQQEIAATSIGRHPNDRSVSFYFRNPSRWFIEYGWDLRTVDPDNVTEESYILRPGIGWGHDGLRNLEDGSVPAK